ncbi:MAG TPA: hypothetical protein ENN81_08400 [Phycisphaerales bacterium]|nr:hypothetical protein [Phycisphaerales bacterium]
MRKVGLLGLVVVVAVVATWAAYGYAEGRQSSVAAGQPAGCAMVCESGGCGGAGLGCQDCPCFVDEDGDGVCDKAGTCGRGAGNGCRARKGRCGR